MIRIRTEADWQAIGIHHPHLRFFCERWLELLDSATPVAHRAALAGAPEILREIDGIRKRHGGSSHASGAMRALYEEAFGVEDRGFKRVVGTVAGDEIAQSLVGPLLTQRERAVALAGGGSAPENVSHARERAASRAMSQVLARLYLPSIVDALRTTVFDTPESRETARRLDRLTSALVSELLAVGFADSFLRVHAHILEIRDERMESERDRFDRFAQRLLSADEKVDVAFRVQGRSDLWEQWPEHLSALRELPTEPPARSAESQRWKQFALANPTVRFVELAVVARDHHAATRLAAYEFQRHADLAFVGGPQQDPIILAAVTVRGPAPGKLTVVEGRQLELGSVPVRRSALRYGGGSDEIASALSSPTVAEDSKRRLSGAVRYYRISVGQSWPESGLANLWTALEVLASTDYGENIIDRVVRSIVPILASGKVRDMVDDAVGYMLSAGLHRDEQFREKHPSLFEEGRLMPHLLLGRVAERSKALELAAPFMNRSPLMVTRIMELSESLKSGLSLANRVHRTARRIEWQIRRLYRLRNDGVHGAAMAQNASRMLGYLRLYVYETVVVQSTVLAADNALESIEDAVAATDAAYQHWMERLLVMKDIHPLGVEQWAELYRPPYEALVQRYSMHR